METDFRVGRGEPPPVTAECSQGGAACWMDNGKGATWDRQSKHTSILFAGARIGGGASPPAARNHSDGFQLTELAAGDIAPRALRV